jgi:hypothetical protein
VGILPAEGRLNNLVEFQKAEAGGNGQLPPDGWLGDVSELDAEVEEHRDEIKSHQ